MQKNSNAELLSIATRLTRADDREAIIDLVGGFVSSLVAASRVSICLVDPADPDYVVVHMLRENDGALASGSRLSIAGTMLGEAIASGLPTSSRFDQVEVAVVESLKAANVGSAVHAPLNSSSHCYGTLNAGYSSITDIGPGDIDTLTNLATLLASQIERVDNRHALERSTRARHAQIEQLAKLNGLEARLSHAASTREAIDVLSQKIREIVDVDRLSFAERGPHATIYPIQEHGPLGPQGVVDVDEAAFEQRFTPSEPLHYVDDLATTGKPIHQHLLSVGIRSSLRIGVFVKGRPVGTLDLGSRQIDGFGPDQQIILTTVASFLGGTIERITSLERLAFQASHDALTGLLGRTLFDEMLTAEIASPPRDNLPSAVAFFDIDGFKMVNDTVGHQAGDALILEVTERIGACLGPNDLMARIGGDEFAMLLRQRTQRGYSQLLDRIVESVSSTTFIAGGRNMMSAISLGFALIDGCNMTAPDILAAADAACYAAKAEGGNRARQASTTDQEQTTRRTVGTILHRLQRAIETDHLVLFGQPIHTVADQAAEALEVLVRIPDDAGGIMRPGQYVPFAEQYRMITELDCWVTEHALAEFAVMSNLSEGPTIFINLSPSSITTTGFAQDIAHIVESSGVRPDRICFEITETGTMRSFTTALQFITTLKRLGVLVALDDFGVGLSSLSHLQRLPVDVLKIDGSLTTDLDTDQTNALMVTAISAMARALDITTIAERVESEAVFAQLAQSGIDYAQGFYCGRPQPLREVLDQFLSAPTTQFSGRLARLRSADQMVEEAQRSNR